MLSVQASGTLYTVLVSNLLHYTVGCLARTPGKTYCHFSKTVNNVTPNSFSFI